MTGSMADAFVGVTNVSPEEEEDDDDVEAMLIAKVRGLNDGVKNWMKDLKSYSFPVSLICMLPEQIVWKVRFRRDLQSRHKLCNKLELVLKGLMQMRLFLSDAERSDVVMKNWVEDLKGVASEVEGVIDKFIQDTVTKMGFRKRLLLHWQDPQTLLKFRKELKKVVIKIDNIFTQAVSHGIVYIKGDQSSSSVHPYRRTLSFIDKQRQELLVQEKQEIETQLTTGETERRVISIVGLMESGKTALAWETYNSEAVKEKFPCRVWVNVFQLYDTGEILQEIAQQVKLYELQPDTRTIREEELVQKLCDFLKTSTYLIVLAEVWTIKIWNKLQAAFPDSHNGSRILLVTRNEDVPLQSWLLYASDGWDWKRTTRFSRLTSEFVRFSRHLSWQKRSSTEDVSCELPEIVRHGTGTRLKDDESWELFTRKVQVPSEFEQIARELVKNCEDMPLTIARLAAVLSMKDATPEEEEWTRTFRLSHKPGKLRMYIMAMNGDNDLPLYLMRCLLYVVYNFRANSKIPARRLIALWIAEGLVEDTPFGLSNEDDGLSSEDVAETYLTALINRNLIQVAKQKFDGEVKSCRLPNDARQQFWLSKAKEANILLSHRTRNSMSESSPPSKEMILRLVDHLDEKDACFIHLHGTDKNPSLHRYKYISSFLSFDLREGSKPGEDIDNFLHRGISSRCFKLLRVLDLEDVFKPRLNRVIGKLIHLRYLGLRRTFLDTLPSSIGNLKYLQTLDVKHTYINNLPSSIWKMQHLRHLYLHNTRFEPVRGGTLPHLQTLWGVLVDNESQVKSGLDRSTDLRFLELTCRSMLEKSQQALAQWIGELGNLRSLRLISTNDSGRPSDLYLNSLSGLGDLSTLYMRGKLQKLFDVTEFPKSLTGLTLSASELRVDPMQTLEKLPNLRILELYSGSYTWTSMLCSSKGFHQLRQLRLWKLAELKKWTVEKEAMPSIREIEIRFCFKLEMLPDGLQNLSTLRILKLTGMPQEFTAKVDGNKIPPSCIIRSE
ncbi:hypothetical protein HHK36_005978 [Tetracentron sinense]|uniref:Uncharacterized protein n=1 Tax=Tetracentron sinense TaxID=13715 RepID=A0A834ZHS7_TETSI|nr:hypothetical protein HHK36_005978 [Tetracentron sinense]